MLKYTDTKRAMSLTLISTLRQKDEAIAGSFLVGAWGENGRGPAQAIKKQHSKYDDNAKH